MSPRNFHANTQALAQYDTADDERSSRMVSSPLKAHLRKLWRATRRRGRNVHRLLWPVVTGGSDAERRVPADDTGAADAFFYLQDFVQAIRESPECGEVIEIDTQQTAWLKHLCAAGESRLNRDSRRDGRQVRSRTEGRAYIDCDLAGGLFVGMKGRKRRMRHRKG